MDEELGVLGGNCPCRLHMQHSGGASYLSAVCACIDPAMQLNQSTVSAVRCSTINRYCAFQHSVKSEDFKLTAEISAATIDLDT